MLRAGILALLLLCAVAGFAGTITVTTPGAGDFLGRNNTVRFNVTGAVQQVLVVVTATNVANPNVQIRLESRINPGANGQGQGTVALNFNPNTPQGLWRIQVVASEPTNPGKTYNTVPPFNVTVDTENPRFLDVNPLTGSFVRGVVPIRVVLDEPNVREWRVRVNNNDIPNNSGNTRNFTVNWNTNPIPTDGSQSINIRVEDLAGNTATRNLNVTVDRIRPTIQILSPRDNQTLANNSILPVAIDIVDQFNNSVALTGVDVTLVQMDGRFIARVPRLSVRSSGNTLNWTGRITYRSSLPQEFKMRVTAVDRAGNVAILREVRIVLPGRAGGTNGLYSTPWGRLILG